MGGFFVFGDVSVHAGGEEFGIVGLDLDEISDRVASGYLLGLGRWKSEMSTVPHDEHAFAVLRNTVLLAINNTMPNFIPTGLKVFYKLSENLMLL